MCPMCGKREPVLQSVVTDKWECRAELNGCGAVFDMPVPSPLEGLSTVDDAVKAMTDAIRKFEHTEHPLGQPCLLDMERRTTELLDLLKNEIGRLATLFNE